jgi:hypothetical protein
MACARQPCTRYWFASSEGLNAWFYAVHAQEVAAKLGLGTDHAVL